MKKFLWAVFAASAVTVVLTLIAFLIFGPNDMPNSVSLFIGFMSGSTFATVRYAKM